MPDFSQDGAAFRIDTPLGQDELVLDGFTGAEGISSPFEFSATVSSRNESVDPASLLEQRVTLSIHSESAPLRHFDGFVRRFGFLGKRHQLAGYTLDIVPWLWFLSLRSDHRIFQNKSVLEIIKDVFAAHPEAAFRMNCTGSYKPREYCTQYGESDLAFVSRLMEEEGIFYYFEHSDGAHEMVLADDAGQMKACPGRDTFQVSDSPAGRGELSTITSFTWEQGVATRKVTLRDYDYLKPSMNLEASKGSGSPWERYEFPGRYVELRQGETYATTRLQESEAMLEVGHGSSDGPTLIAGHRFTVEDHPMSKANAEYLLTGVTHSAHSGGVRSGGDAADYNNSFECIPVGTKYRPPSETPRPIVHGSQTAVVVGPSGEEIYTDEHGRIKVQFHWDRQGKKDENSSCWIRVATSWAGKGWGSVHLPRIGQEVVVGFLEGNPDRPLVTASVYNAENTSSLSFPSNMTQSAIRSNSSKGGGGFNELRMEDKKGSELVFFQAQKDKRVNVKNNRSETVGNDETISIGNDRNETVGSNESIAIGTDQTISIGTDQTISIGSNRTEDVGSNEKITIGGDRTERVTGDEELDVGGAREESIGKGEKISIGENRSVQIGKNSEISAGKKMTFSAADQIILRTGKAQIVMKKDGTITIEGKDITVDGSGKINLKASSTVTIKGSAIKQN